MGFILQEKFGCFKGEFGKCRIAKLGGGTQTAFAYGQLSTLPDHVLLGNLKPNPSPIVSYPSLNASLTASLMQAVKGLNKGKHVPHRQNLSWVKESRGG